MKARTNDFKETIKGLKEISGKITYAINGVATELGDEELNSVQPHYQGSLLKSIMKELDLDSNVDIPKETIINYQFGVKVNNTYEYINYGNYVVYSSEKQEDTNSYLIKCYDKMLYSMVDYESFATYPITIRDYINALCTHIGLVFKNKNDYFTNYDKTIESELYLDENGNSLGYKFRDVLDELAQVTGSIICINEEDDELEIRYPSDAGAIRTSVSGKTLTLANVDDIKVDDIELIGETTQAGTPSPSSPVEVQTITGRQEIRTCGKNLLNKDNWVSGYYNSSGVWNTSTTNATFDYISAIPNATYTLSTKVNCSFLAITEFNASKTFIKRTQVVNNKINTITADSNTKYIRVIINRNNADITQEVIDNITPQLEKGSTTTTYEPYKEQVNEINLGKNLYEGSQDFSGTWEYGSSWETDSQTFNGCVVKKRAGSWNGINKTFPVVSGKTYTFSVYAKADESRNCGLYLSNAVTPTSSTINITTEWQRYSITFTANSNSTIRPRIENQTNSSTNYTYIACFQLEYGSQATSYSEYFTPIELCKIGTYEDKIFKTTGKNLFDKDDNTMILNSVYVNTSTGKIQSASNSTCVYIECKSNTTYTISKTAGTRFVVGSTNETPTLNLILNNYTSNANASSITFRTGANDIYLVAWIWSGGTDTTITSSQMLASVQIEKGTQATPYEPYSNNEWYVKKAIGKRVLNGTENWDVIGDNRYWLAFSDKRGLTSAVANAIYSNYFKATSNAGGTVGIGEMTEGYYTIANYNMFFNYNGTNTDLAGFKTWLSTHNTIVYYVLSTPTYEKLNDELQNELNNILLLEGLNNVSSSVPINLNYVSDMDTIDEEFFDESNVNFGEVYGPVNTIILSRSAESDELAKSLVENEEDRIAIKISDNQILNFDGREEYLSGLLNRLSGTMYVQNDYTSKGICYYNIGDRYKAYIFGKYYRCLMLNDDVTIESGLSENVSTEIPETAKTDYSKTSTSDKTVRKANLIVDKQLGEIRGEVEDLQTSINGDNGLATRMTRAETKLNSQEATLTFIEENTLNEDGSVKALSTPNTSNTTTYTFDKNGIKIGKSTDDYNSLQDNTGTYYYEKDTMIGKYTKDGSVQKDLALFGKYYYGIEETLDVSSFSREDALFLAQLYNDGTEQGFGHFYNSNE